MTSTDATNYGFDVKIRFRKGSVYCRDIFDVLAGNERTTLHNITEIHYRYDGSPRIAFESDVHGTGYTYAIKDIAEFESVVATKKASWV